MEFRNRRVSSTFTSADNQNAGGKIEGLGWRKVKKQSDDGVTNVFLMLVAAKANGRTVIGKTDANDQITELYLQ